MASYDRPNDRSRRLFETTRVEDSAIAAAAAMSGVEQPCCGEWVPEKPPKRDGRHVWRFAGRPSTAVEGSRLACETNNVVRSPVPKGGGWAHPVKLITWAFNQTASPQGSVRAGSS